MTAGRRQTHDGYWSVRTHRHQRRLSFHKSNTDRINGAGVVGRQAVGELAEHHNDVTLVMVVIGIQRGSAGINDFARIQSNGDVVRRSEEHTSELQSLMRISYAAFCLKKKK